MRSRAMTGLFSGVALVSTAWVGVSTVSTLVAAEAEGPKWSGVPSAVAVFGSAVGSVALGALMARHGPRLSLMATYLLAAVGAVIAAAAAWRQSVVPLLGGMFLLGLGQAAAQLSRYAAAELYPLRRRGFGLSLLVWASTVGALAGPALIAPAAREAESLGIPGFSGPGLLAAGLILLAIAVSALAPSASLTRPESSRSWVALRRRAVLTPLLSMVCAQVVMVAVMTMTPLQLHSHGHGLGVIGWVLSAHMIGMFALAPLSGLVADRWGGRVALATGFGTLLIATLMAALNASGVGSLAVALLLLGFGWNQVFVGGSSLLGPELATAERGAVDGLIWLGSAFAGLAAGPLMAAGGYDLVGLVALLLLLLRAGDLVRAGRHRKERSTSTVDSPVARL